MCALFAKIVALLAKQDRWIKEITLTMYVNRIGQPARGQMDSQLTILRPDVGCQQAHPLDGWLLIGLH